MVAFKFDLLYSFCMLNCDCAKPICRHNPTPNSSPTTPDAIISANMVWSFLGSRFDSFHDNYHGSSPKG
ncbi:hypothetical protein ACHHYP_20838 [Achlya hypogyna]|uniref:Uncharacterized protein n=1 Tax=Achlya hypogyna TaxID=1202772 RepID=A0A1V9Y5P3_ACHHY|nr:hypothetical protein ACHHYP_20838 [Achlya hypogyna]